MLNRERAARLVEHHARDRNQPGLDEVIDRLLTSTSKTEPPPGASAEVHRAVDSVAL